MQISVGKSETDKIVLEINKYAFELSAKSSKGKISYDKYENFIYKLEEWLDTLEERSEYLD